MLTNLQVAAVAEAVEVHPEVEVPPGEVPGEVPRW